MSGTAPPEPCPICSAEPGGSKGRLVLDAQRVFAAQKRWPWAKLGPGENECPGCVQVPPGPTKQ